MACFIPSHKLRAQYVFSPSLASGNRVSHGRHNSLAPLTVPLHELDEQEESNKNDAHRLIQGGLGGGGGIQLPPPSPKKRTVQLLPQDRNY